MDYLEHSKIRALFKENALNPEDAALFEMPEYTGEGQTPIRVILEQDGPACCYPNPEELRQMSRGRRCLYVYKCHIMVFSLIGIISIMLISVVVMLGTKDTNK
jgi:hypothetical protein